MPYKVLPHTGDFMLRASGSSLEELFTSAVTGMFEAVKPRYVKGDPPVERAFFIQTDTVEQLLVDLLSEAVSLSDMFHEAYDNVSFTTITESEAKGTFRGYPVTAFETQIKAVTYHGLDVKQDAKGKWEVTITFDV